MQWLACNSTCYHPFRTLPQDVVIIIQESMLRMLIPTAAVHWLMSPYQADNSGNCTQVTIDATCILSQ